MLARTQGAMTSTALQCGTEAALRGDAVRVCGQGLYTRYSIVVLGLDVARVLLGMVLRWTGRQLWVCQRGGRCRGTGTCSVHDVSAVGSTGKL